MDCLEAMDNDQKPSQMDNKTDLFLEYKNLLFSIAYNMLGDVAAAEDIVQDSFIKWRETTGNEIRHVKAYLGKLVTNKCINYLNSARANREKYVGTWLPEPVLNYSAGSPHNRIESYHALSIGMLVLLEKLTPQERAIFLLKEISSYDYAEIAEIFEKTEDNCRQILRRAKQNLGNDAKRFEVDLKVHERILNNFLLAVSEGNMNELIELLKEDIVLYADGDGRFRPAGAQKLTAVRKPIYGKEKVGRLLMRVTSKILQYIPDFNREVIVANGLPSILSYSGNEPVSLVSLEPEGDRIRNIYIQTNPQKLKQFLKRKV
jgi:RNA polymerase sigma-70 factor (ECF subfamily)